MTKFYFRVTDPFRKHTVSRIPWTVLADYQIGGRS